MNIKHVGLNNQKLHLELNNMAKEQKRLNKLLSTVHNTMRDAMQKLKNSAILRNITHLISALENVTRRSSKYVMLSRFNRIVEKLITVASVEDTELCDRRAN